MVCSMNHKQFMHSRRYLCMVCTLILMYQMHSQLDFVNDHEFCSLNSVTSRTACLQTVVKFQSLKQQDDMDCTFEQCCVTSLTLLLASHSLTARFMAHMTKASHSFSLCLCVYLVTCFWHSSPCSLCPATQLV